LRFPPHIVAQLTLAYYKILSAACFRVIPLRLSPDHKLAMATSGPSSKRLNPKPHATPAGFLGFLDLTDDRADAVMGVDTRVIDLTADDAQWIDLTASEDMN
jgi:hypothetical protein